MPRIKRESGQNTLEKGMHAVDISVAVEHYMRDFFQSKSWYCGGRIPQRDLFSDASIKTVLRTTFCKEWEEFVHAKCLPTIPLDPSYKAAAHLPWTVRCLIDLLDSMGSCAIPKEFRPGMVLLYFKFCKGVKIPPPPIL